MRPALAGAGKTTARHTVSVLLRLHQGSITLQGQALHHETPQRMVEAGLIHIAASCSPP